ncbi:MAG: hypothetical protein ACRECW_20690, partial [Phyllobacterium sp.]
MAYSENIGMAEDWRSFYANGYQAGPDAWNALSSKARYGLSWGELMRTHQYSGIVAAPMYDDQGHRVGCVVIDAPLSIADMSSLEMQVILRDTAA